jgi:hypothetical protein
MVVVLTGLLDGIVEEKNRGFKANTFVNFIHFYSKAFRHINWKKITKFYIYGTENCIVLLRDLLRLLWADLRNLVFFLLQSPLGIATVMALMIDGQ